MKICKKKKKTFRVKNLFEFVFNSFVNNDRRPGFIEQWTLGQKMGKNGLPLSGNFFIDNPFFSRHLI